VAENQAFKDYRDPIEYVVNQNKFKEIYKNRNLTGGKYELKGGLTNADGTLPETPARLLRGENGLVTEIVYGENDGGGEASPYVWREKLIRENGKVTKIITVFPDGSEAAQALVRNSEGKVEQIIYEQGGF
jgi:hypothetical protein